LGERQAGSLKVTGSSPVSSTLIFNRAALILIGRLASIQLLP
jgi:hypothetical protein